MVRGDNTWYRLDTVRGVRLLQSYQFHDPLWGKTSVACILSWEDGERTNPVIPFEFHHIVFDFRDLIDVEERRGGRLTVILPYNPMEQDRESRVRKDRLIDKRIDHLTRSGSLKISFVKTLVGKLENCFMGPEILDEFNDAGARQ